MTGFAAPPNGDCEADNAAIPLLVAVDVPKPEVVAGADVGVEVPDPNSEDLGAAPNGVVASLFGFSPNPLELTNELDAVVVTVEDAGVVASGATRLACLTRPPPAVAS